AVSNNHVSIGGYCERRCTNLHYVYFQGYDWSCRTTIRTQLNNLDSVLTRTNVTYRDVKLIGRSSDKDSHTSRALFAGVRNRGAPSRITGSRAYRRVPDVDAEAGQRS